MKTATTVCAAKCLIANINIVDLIEIYGRLCSLCYWKCFTNNSKGHWEVKIISIAAEGTYINNGD